MNTYTQTDDNIKPLSNSLEVVGGLFSTKYLERFKIFYPKTLFPPNFENLQKNCCPVCGRKLYFNQKKTIARCKSKANDKFIITTKRLLQLGGSLK